MLREKKTLRFILKESIYVEDMQEELKDYCSDFIITKDVSSAFEKAKSIAGLHDLICITGSVYLAGEVMQLI